METPQTGILNTASSGGNNTSFQESGKGVRNDNDLRGQNSVPNNYSISKFIAKKVPRAGQVVQDRSKSTTSAFPAQIQHGDPRDNRYATLNNVLSSDGMTIPGFGQYMASDRDLDYLTTKLEDAKNANFKQWLYSQVDLKDPVYQKFWQEKLPGLYTERMQLIEDQIDLHTQLAKINLRGPQDIEDFMLLYGLDTGEIPLPTMPFFTPEGVSKKNFNRGMFNVNNWFTSVPSNQGILWNHPLDIPKYSTGGRDPMGHNTQSISGWGGFNRAYST